MKLLRLKMNSEHVLLVIYLVISILTSVFEENYISIACLALS